MYKALPESPPPLRAAADTREQELARRKTLALALLLFMLAGLGLSISRGEQGAWAWIGAFCEAAVIGALADWFAVEALFRRPLGLPIPHTAIVPANKDRIAASLANFIDARFLSVESLLGLLARDDFARKLTAALADPARLDSLTQTARQGLLKALRFCDRAAVRGQLKAVVVRQLHQLDLAILIPALHGLLTAGGRHQHLLDQGLKWLGGWLTRPDVKRRVSGQIVRHLQRHWPRISRIVGLFRPMANVGDEMAESLAATVLDELSQVLLDPGHALRRQYETALGEFSRQLGEDPALARSLAQFKEALIDSPAVQDYVQLVLLQLEARLQEDLARPDSKTMRHLRQVLAGLQQGLQTEPGLADQASRFLRDRIPTVSRFLSRLVPPHVHATVTDWKDAELVRELELSLGSDLQRIRFNGTLVGGLIGVLLFALREFFQV